MGHSYGGRIAVHLSRLKKYKKIVVIASPLVKVDKAKDSISIFKFYKFIHKLNLISDEKLEKIKKKYGSEDYKNANKYLRDTLVMAVNDDLVQILPKIDTHVDLVYGEYDMTVLPQNGTIANKIIPDSDLTILPKENHFCLNSSKEKIIEIIKR